MAVTVYGSDTLTGEPYTTLLDSTVLFLSHNKVLSSHVRAWAESLLAEWGIGRDRIHVAHSTAYLKARRTRWDLDLGSFDERAADAVRSVPLLGEDDAFDTLLLDEAQDAAGWVRELMLRSSKDGSDWFLGYGPSQALYASDSAWVEEVAASGQVVQLRRSWRSRDWAFIEAQAFYECSPDTGELEAWLPPRWPPRPRPDRTGTIGLFDVDVETTGGPFVLRGLNDDDLAQFDESHPGFPVAKQEVVAREVTQALEQLDHEIKPGDTLLILVPRVDGALTSGAREAVAAWGDRWQDMTSDHARDQYGSDVPVTLSTYHSARGIQADHVLILGIEELAGLASEAADAMEHVRRLGYLSLSRARVTTTVLVPQSTRDPHVEFLRELTARMRMLRPDPFVAVAPESGPAPQLPPWKPCTITAWKDSAGWIRDGEESQRQYPVAGDRLLGVRPSRVTSGMKLHYLPQAGSLGVRLLAHQIHRWFDLTSEGLSFVRVRHRSEETGDGVGVGLHDDRDVIIAADLMKQLDLQPGSTAQLTIEDGGVTWRATGGRSWPVED